MSIDLVEDILGALFDGRGVILRRQVQKEQRRRVHAAGKRALSQEQVIDIEPLVIGASIFDLLPGVRGLVMAYMQYRSNDDLFARCRRCIRLQNAGEVDRESLSIAELFATHVLLLPVQ